MSAGVPKSDSENNLPGGDVTKVRFEEFSRLLVVTLAEVNQRRKAKGEKRLYQKHIAQQLGIREGTVSYWFNGLTAPEDDTLIKLADTLETDPNVLRMSLLGPVNPLNLLARKLASEGDLRLLNNLEDLWELGATIYPNRQIDPEKITPRQVDKIIIWVETILAAYRQLVPFSDFDMNLEGPDENGDGENTAFTAVESNGSN